MEEDILIYLVDDEKLIVESLSKMLQRRLPPQIRVKAFHNGRSVLTSMQSEPCDLLIADIRMPGMTGLDLLRQLRERGYQFEAIMLTGYDTFAYTYAAIHQNVFSYLLKMEPDDEVVRVVSQAIDKIRQRRAMEARIRAADEKLSEKETEAQAQEAVGDLSEERIHRIAEQVKRYIRDHLAGDLSTTALADVMGYSEPHLARLFRNSQGITLHQYVQDYRIERAKTLLRSTNQKIYVVAATCGYANTAYFIRVFKGKTGVTPQEYRDGRDKA